MRDVNDLHVPSDATITLSCRASLNTEWFTFFVDVGYYSKEAIEQVLCFFKHAGSIGNKLA